MGVAADLLANAEGFIKAATNFVGIVEKNLDALSRIKRKNQLQRQLAAVEEVLSIFPQLMYMNGVFITGFSKEYVMSVDGADRCTHSRDAPIIDEFAGMLDDVEKVFNRDAQVIRGLGSDMVVQFRQGIALRRKILEQYHSGSLDAVSEDDAMNVRQKLDALYNVENRVYTILKSLEQKVSRRSP
jgi:hypothetical protein